jgi:hypothetical protein
VKKIFTLSIIISILFINLSYGDNNQIKDVYKIKSNVSKLYPEYDKKVKNYYIKDCNKKFVELSFIRYKDIIKKSYLFIEGKSNKIKVNNNIINILCLNKSIEDSSYSFDSFNKADGYTLLDRASYTILYDINGVPVWYNNYQNYIPYFSAISKEGVLTSLLFEGKFFLDSTFSLKNNNPKVHILKYNLIKDKVSSIITPYELIDNKKVYPDIDYHGFHESRTGYYFIGYKDEYYDKIPEEYSITDRLISGNSDIINKCNNSKKINIVRKPRLLKSNKNGEIIWSHIINLKTNYNMNNITYLENNNEVSCIVDVNHPNSIYADLSEEKIIVGLHNNYILIIDKEIEYILFKNINKESIGKDFDIPKKGDILKVIDDPLGGVCRTHSGSINNDNELIVFDNRCSPNEASRAVIYKIDYNKKTAVYKKSFYLDKFKEHCSISIIGTLNCNTLNMGNAFFGNNGEIVINWGNIEKNKAIASIYDKNYNKLLDISARYIDYGEDKKIYKVSYYNNNYLKNIISKLKEYDYSEFAQRERERFITNKLFI